MKKILIAITVLASVIISIYFIPKLYNQSNNIKILEELNQQNRVIPHFVDFTGKLYEIWNVSGYRAFEIDVIFNEKEKVFKIGHDNPTGKTLEDFLKFIDAKQLKKIWLDWKNLTKNNSKMALQRLEYLDKKYQIKKIAILESGLDSIKFDDFTKAGWQTSFYLPTHEILDKKIDLKVLINKINDNNIMAISFDYRLYDFVIENLENNISKTLVYHTWDTTKKLENKSFIENIKNKKYYNDERVKTILVTYRSLLHFIK